MGTYNWTDHSYCEIWVWPNMSMPVRVGIISHNNTQPILAWGTHTGMKNPYWHEGPTLVWGTHTGMKNPYWHEEPILVWGTHTGMRDSYWDEEPTLAWGTHTGMRNPHWYEEPTLAWGTHTVCQAHTIKYTGVNAKYWKMYHTRHLSEFVRPIMTCTYHNQQQNWPGLHQ